MRRGSHVVLGSLLTLASSSAVSGCKDRSPEWDRPIQRPAVSVSGAGAVAIVDEPEERVVFLSIEGNLSTNESAVPIGRGVAKTSVTPDRGHVLVLTRGDVP